MGRDPQSVTLMAVSKTFPVERIQEVLDAGIADFGENYVQELTQKKTNLGGARDLRWHMIGHLQSNKVKYIVEWIYMIHSIDNEGLAAEIQKRASKSDIKVKVLVEVNTSREATKFGIQPSEAIELLHRVSSFPNLELKGLMTIGPFTDDASQSRASFRLLKSIFDEANQKSFLRTPLSILSMGMSHDYTIAIEEGSTMVRIGTAIFGSRTSQKKEEQ